MIRAAGKQFLSRRTLSPRVVSRKNPSNLHVAAAARTASFTERHFGSLTGSSFGIQRDFYVGVEPTRNDHNYRGNAAANSPSKTSQLPEQPPQLADMISTTQGLLKDPPGSLSTYKWRDGQQALRWWTTREYPFHDFRGRGEGREYSCRLFQRLLEEREHLRGRVVQAHAVVPADNTHTSATSTPLQASAADILVDQCYAMEEGSAEILQRIVTLWYDEEKGFHHPGNTRLRDWVKDMEDRFNIRPTDQVASILKLDATTRPTVEKLDFIAEMRRLRLNNPHRKNDRDHPLVAAKAKEKDHLQESNFRMERKQFTVEQEVMVDFERDWKAAGLEWTDAQEQVEESDKGYQILKVVNNNSSIDGGTSTDNDNRNAQKAFLFALKAWESAAKKVPELASQHADNLLYRMLGLYLEHGYQGAKPCRQSFQLVISTHVAAGKPEAADRVLHDMLILYQETNDKAFLPMDGPGIADDELEENNSSSPSMEACPQVLFTPEKPSGNDDLHYRVEGDKENPYEVSKCAIQLLNKAIGQRQAKNATQQAKPDNQNLPMLLSSHTANKNADAANKVLQDMLRSYKVTKNADVLPDRQCFLSVLTTYLTHRRKDRRMVYKSSSLLVQMLELAGSTGDLSLVPPHSVVEYILNLLASTYRYDVGELSEVILLRLQEVQDKHRKHADIKLPVKYFDLLLQSWANSSHPLSLSRIEKIQSFVKKNPSLFDKPVHVRPHFGYLPLLQAFSRKSRSKNQKTVMKMEKAFDEFRAHFDSEDVSSFDIIAAYKARIATYEFLGNPRRAAELSRLAFDELMKLRKIGLVKHTPDPGLYASVAYSFAKTGNVPKVKEMIQQMSDSWGGLKPNKKLYDCLLLALSKSNDSSSWVEAEFILSEMEKSFHRGDLADKPDARSYGAVMNCLCNSRDPNAAERVEGYLQKLKQMYEITGDESLRTNNMLYTTVMKSLALRRSPAAADKAQALLEEMKMLEQQGDKKAKPDIVTYTAYLKVLRMSNPPDRASRVAAAISDMRQRGWQLDGIALQELQAL